MSLKINIVFHKTLYSDAYSSLPFSFVKDHFRFIAVNDDIKKDIPTELEPLIFYENQFELYKSQLQKEHYKENSLLIHYYLNPSEFESADFIGFFQYDMRFSELFAQHIDIMKDLMKKNRNQIFVLNSQNSLIHLTNILAPSDWQKIINIYNFVYETNHEINDIMKDDIPLWNSYILPSHICKELVAFLSKISDEARLILANRDKLDPLSFPIIMEFTNGVFLQLYSKDNNCRDWYTLNGIYHTLQKI